MDLFSLLAGGISGGSTGGLGGLGGLGNPAQFMALEQEAMKRPKPGKRCMANCMASGNACQACLAQQQRVDTALRELTQLDARIAQAQYAPSRPAGPRPTHCARCGAPIQMGRSACPYCSTPYPYAPSAGGGAGEIPASPMERERLLFQKALELHRIYADMRDMELEANLAARTALGFPPFMLAATRSGMPQSKALYRMSPAQLTEGARHYGTTVPAYVVGVIDHIYKAVPQLQKEKSDADAEAARKAREAARAADPTPWFPTSSVAANYGYNAYTMSTCAQCAYYSPAEGGLCGFNRQRTKASDTCNHFRSR